MMEGRNMNLIFMDSHPFQDFKYVDPVSTELVRNNGHFERYIKKKKLNDERQGSYQKIVVINSKKKQSRSKVDNILQVKVGSDPGNLTGLMIIPGMIKLNNLKNKRSKILPQDLNVLTEQFSQRKTYSQQYQRKMIKSYSAVKKNQGANKQSQNYKKKTISNEQFSVNHNNKKVIQEIGMFWGKNKNLKNIYVKPNIIRRKATSFVQLQSQDWKDQKTQQKQQVSPRTPTKFDKAKQLNVEIILRSKYMKDFDAYIRQYQKKMELKHNTKIFVFNSSDKWVKKYTIDTYRILIQRGWVQNVIKDSLAYNLKWTTKVQPTPTFKKQMHNHFTQSDELTSKSGLISNTKNCFQIRKYIPKSYQIGPQTSQFLKQFDRSLFLCLFRNIVASLKKSLKYFQPQYQQIPSHLDLFNEFSYLISSSNYFGDHDQKTIIHLPYTLMLCSHLLCTYFKFNSINGNQFPAIDQNFMILSKASQQKLIAFSKVKPPYNQHKNIRKSQYRSQSFTKRQLTFGPTINQYYTQCSFDTPSKELIAFIFKLDEYLNHILTSYQTQGEQNLWIIKCATSSKGTGIKISNNSEILRCGQNKIVQKYIQRCLILYPTSKQFEFISGKKFDLRVWVLAKKFSSPMKICYYYDFYARICADQYDLIDLNTLTKHLTNYSKNKGNYSNEQNSVIYSEDLLKIIAQNRQTSKEIISKKFHSQLKTLLKNLMKCYEGKIANQKNSFQLYGCDILLDQQLNLHLLEVNLSPACSQRVQWLTNMLQQMTRSMLDIVLGEQENKHYPNKWIDLFQ